MNVLPLHQFHQELNAQFVELNGAEAVAEYGDSLAEQTALRSRLGFLDLSFRSRLCLTGADRVRFLHGQVTNDIKGLTAGTGCYAALVTAKGKMESDLNLYVLADELLLDFEPGLGQSVSRRLEKYIVADDVQVVDAALQYGLLSVQGPQSEAAIRGLDFFKSIPARSFEFSVTADRTAGDVYLMNQPRLNSIGFDLYVPVPALDSFAGKLLSVVRSAGGQACGWQALETVRIEAGIPRFGADMDETNLPLECGIEGRAVSYRKGCYIGQEIINRVHSFGRVTKELRGLLLAADLVSLPGKGDRLWHEGRDAGYITSAIRSPWLNANVALGYVRTEANRPGTLLTLRQSEQESQAEVTALPFRAG